MAELRGKDTHIARACESEYWSKVVGVVYHVIHLHQSVINRKIFYLFKKRSHTDA